MEKVMQTEFRVRMCGVKRVLMLTLLLTALSSLAPGALARSADTRDRLLDASPRLGTNQGQSSQGSSGQTSHGAGGTSADTPDSGDNYYNTSQNPVTNQLQSIQSNPDQKRYATSNLTHGEHGELESGSETVKTAGAHWPAIVQPQSVKLDPRSAAAVKAVKEATGLGGSDGGTAGAVAGAAGDVAAGVAEGVAGAVAGSVGEAVAGAVGDAIGGAIDGIFGGGGGSDSISGNAGANILSGNVASTAMAVG